MLYLTIIKNLLRTYENGTMKKLMLNRLNKHGRTRQKLLIKQNGHETQLIKHT